MQTVTVNLTPNDTANLIQQYISNSGLSTQCIGTYGNISPEGRQAVMLGFEKYFMRNSSRASLSVMVENLSGPTRVCALGSGGGQNALFKFDWGASGDFEGLIWSALQGHMVG